jgi:hypothetical protein
MTLPPLPQQRDMVAGFTKGVFIVNKIVKSLVVISTAGFLLCSANCGTPTKIKSNKPFVFITQETLNKLEEAAAAVNTEPVKVQEIKQMAENNKQTEIERIHKEKFEYEKSLVTGKGLTTPTPADISAEQLDQQRHDWIIAELKRQDEIRAQELEKKRRAERIRRWISDRNAPYTYLAEYIVNEANRTGVSPYLCVAVGEAESTSGHSKRAQENIDAWGMLGCSFGSWEEAITYWFDNCLYHWGQAQNGWDLENSPTPYCETNQEEYAANVTGLCKEIAAIDVGF